MAAAPDPNIRKFKTDVIKELGLQHSQTEQQLLQIALSKPAQYFKLRSILLKTMLEDNVKVMYDIIWNALTLGVYGEEGYEQPILVLDGALAEFRLDGVANIVPNYPEHKVNAIAIAVAQGMKDLIEREVVEKLLPKNLNQIATQKTAASTAAAIAAGNPDI